MAESSSPGAPGCRGRTAATVYGSTYKEEDDTERGGASVSPHTQGRNASLFDGGVIVLWSHLFPFYSKENEGEKESYSCNVLPNVHGNEHCRL